MTSQSTGSLYLILMFLQMDKIIFIAAQEAGFPTVVKARDSHFRELLDSLSTKEPQEQKYLYAWLVAELKKARYINKEMINNICAYYALRRILFGVPVPVVPDEKIESPVDKSIGNK